MIVCEIGGKRRLVDELGFKCHFETEFDKVEPFIGKCETFQNDCEYDRWSALHVCVWLGKIHFMKELLKRGMDPNVTTAVRKQTPLHMALHRYYGRKEEMIELLVKYGANPNCKDVYGIESWNLPAPFETRIPDVIELLIKNGATIRTLNEKTMALIVMVKTKHKLNFLEVCMNKKGTYFDLVPKDLLEFEILPLV